MMNESLRTKPCKQPLRHALFQMQLDNVVGQDSRVLKDHGPNRSIPSPLGQFL